MTMVDWLITEELVGVFREAVAEKPALNVALQPRSPHGESDVLAGSGYAVRIHATEGPDLIVTPRRIARIVDESAYDVVVLADLVGYDWISPEMSEKVALKPVHYDRIYLYPRDSPTVLLDHLGSAVYPLMRFLARVLEFRSQKVLLRKLDDAAVESLGRTLHAAADGPFFSDAELEAHFGRSRHSMRVIAALWPRMNLAAPELRELLIALDAALADKVREGSAAWDEWFGVSRSQVADSVDLFRRVSTGDL